MASDHLPGPEDITANFYKHFWEDIKLLLFQAIKECVNQKELMETMKHGNNETRYNITDTKTRKRRKF